VRGIGGRISGGKEIPLRTALLHGVLAEVQTRSTPNSTEHTNGAAQAPPMQQPQSIPLQGFPLSGACLPNATFCIPGMFMGAIIVESARCPIGMAEEKLDPLRIIPRAMTKLANRRATFRISQL
jgi:hypothetical protein